MYRKGLREIFEKLDKKNKEVIESYRVLLREVIDIVTDSHPQEKLKSLNDQLEEELRQKNITIDINPIPQDESKSVSSIKISGDLSSNHIINNDHEKSLSLASTFSCMIDMNENNDQQKEQDETRKRMKQTNDEFDSKRAMK